VPIGAGERLGLVRSPTRQRVAEEARPNVPRERKPITREEADARKVAGVLGVSREQARVMVRPERRADMVALNSSID
jgi:hypothetical protein